MTTKRLTKLERLVRAYMIGNKAVAHDMSHLLRVRHLAREISLKEGADSEIVEAAALIHDLDRKEDSENDRYYVQSAQDGARLLLKAGYNKNFIRAAVKCAMAHSRSSKTKPVSLEGKVMFDADKIDGLGHVGIVRWYLTMGNMGLDAKRSTELYLNTLTKAHDKLGGHLFTKTGTRMSVELYDFSRDFAVKTLKKLGLDGAT